MGRPMLDAAGEVRAVISVVVSLETVGQIVDSQRIGPERHEGRAWASSEPGKGATFFFQLGRKAAQARLEKVY